MKKIAGILFLLFLAGTGCAQGRSAVKVISAVPDVLREKGTAKLEMNINIEGSDAGTRLSLEVKGEGAFDFQNQRGRITLGVGEDAEEVLLSPLDFDSRLRAGGSRALSMFSVRNSKSKEGAV